MPPAEVVGGGRNTTERANHASNAFWRHFRALREKLVEPPATFPVPPTKLGGASRNVSGALRRRGWRFQQRFRSDWEEFPALSARKTQCLREGGGPIGTPSGPARRLSPPLQHCTSVQKRFCRRRSAPPSPSRPQSRPRSPPQPQSRPQPPSRPPPPSRPRPPSRLVRAACRGSHCRR